MTLDLFKCGVIDPGSLLISSGTTVGGRGTRTVSWTERYRVPGDFKITAAMDSGLFDELPIGSLVSHTDTFEVMMVENINIKEPKRSPATIEISGRSLEAFLENRIVGSNITGGFVTVYTLAAAYTWIQALTMIGDHTHESILIDDYDSIPGLSYTTAVTGTEDTTMARTIKPGTVHERVLELLAVADIGIRVKRTQDDLNSTKIYIHNGIDRVADVVFSYDQGDLENAEYLWSNKNKKNASYNLGKYVESRTVDIGNDSTYVVPARYLDRRMVLLDMTDIEGDLTDQPLIGAVPAIQVKQETRAIQEILARRDVQIAGVNISPQSKHMYRTDYDIGDLVFVDGNYGASGVMRVVEHVEFEDETGESGYPTLSVIPT